MFHLLVSSLSTLRRDESSDIIDKSIRAALQPLREWAGTVMRTKLEYDDFMTNVRVSMLSLYRTIEDLEVSYLSTKQAAEVTTSMHEVAIFLKLRKADPSVEEEEMLEDGHTYPQPSPVKKTRGLLTKLRRLFGSKGP